MVTTTNFVDNARPRARSGVPRSAPALPPSLRTLRASGCASRWRGSHISTAVTCNDEVYIIACTYDAFALKVAPRAAAP